MSLKFNLHQLEFKNLTLKGEIPPSELGWETRDEMIRITQPLRYALEVQRLDNNVLVQGSLRQAIDCTCVRCLKNFLDEVRLDRWSCLLELEGENKVEVINDSVDLTPGIREDIFLAFPQHPLCGPECEGFRHSQQDKGPGGSWESGSASSAWAELDKLKLD